MGRIDDASSRHDLAALQGEWEQVAFEENGVLDPPDVHGGQGALTMIHGHHFKVHSTSGALLLKGVFTLDDSRTPGIMTWVDAMGADKGKSLEAIYRIEGDRFEFIAADPGLPRPRKFKTGPGQTLRRFVRVKPPA